MTNYENGATTRRAIVNAAKRLFYEKGYPETGYGDLCAAAFVNRSTIYYHFKTKDDLRYEVHWEYFIACKRLAERYCPDSRYHYLLAMCIFWREAHDDPKLRRFVLQCCRDFPVYTGKKDFSYFYYACYEVMWGVFWDKRKIPQMAFASVYGYIMSCMRMLCEYPEKYDPMEYGVPFRKLFISYLPVLFLRKLCCLEAGQFAQIPLKYAALQRLFKCRISKVLAGTPCDRGLLGAISKCY